MSNRDGFGSGFWLGTLVGGVVGGIVGATIATQRSNRFGEEGDLNRLTGEPGTKRPLKSSRMRSVDRMEIARQRLDAKINDLNNAIDAVRSSIHVPDNTVEPIANRTEVDSPSRQSGNEQ